MKTLHTHIVPSGIVQQRLSDYAPTVFAQFIPSKKGIKKAIKRGEIRVNGKVGATGIWVVEGQQIDLLESEKPLPKVFPLALSIVYEDEHLAVIVKPAGIPVSGNYFKTIQNALAFNLTPSNATDALQIPRPVHRLDSPTSGVLLIAKTRIAQMDLGQQFERKTVLKTYHALCRGKILANGTISSPIDGKPAKSHFTILKTVFFLKKEPLHLVELQPLTGRTHQLRRHLASVACPIVGDKLYGVAGQIVKGKGLFLCAVGLRFEHPFSKKLVAFSIATPPKFLRILDRGVLEITPSRS